MNRIFRVSKQLIPTSGFSSLHRMSSSDNTGGEKYDLIVIGGGSGGIACARRASEYGAKVVLFEEKYLGGTCVNVGCVPKKVMWNCSNVASIINKYAKHYGYSYDNVTFNFKEVCTRRTEYVKTLNDIYGNNLSKSNVKYYMQKAKISGPNTIESNGKKFIGNNILIAVGGYPYIPDIVGKEYIMTSDDFFNKLTTLPKKICVAGSGYIAVELSNMLQELGTQVYLFIRHDHPLRKFDTLIQKGVHEALKRSGVKVITNTDIKEIIKPNKEENIYNVVTTKTSDSDSKEKDDNVYKEFDCILYAIGRGPNGEELGLNNVGVIQDENGFIPSDEYEQTNIKGIYSIGDINNKIQLTPVAIRAGRKLADRLFGKVNNAKMDYTNVPSIVFSHPPVGSIGLSEEEVKKKIENNTFEKPLTIYETHFTNLFYGIVNSPHHKNKTHMKIICIGPKQKVVGLHMIGDGCDEMLQGFGVAIKMGATKEDFDSITALHPTAAEELVTLRQARGEDNYHYDI